jgi:branched-subunit amino acid aminotransferase/4-amino-4-deoxychorismate lyase
MREGRRHTMTLVMLNGKLEPAERAMVPALDRGLTHGLGLYETLKLIGGVPAFFDEHLTRLEKGLAALGMEDGVGRRELADQIVRLSRADQVPDGACRVLVTAGPPRGQPTVLVQVEVREFPQRPLALISYRSLRSAADLKAKTFTTSHLAQQAAVAAGADDALFVDEQGQAHEATTANLFLCRDGGLFTPPMDGSILPGVVRARMIQLAQAARLPMTEQHILVADLRPTDMLLLTSSVRGIVAAASVDGAPLCVDEALLGSLRGLLAEAEAESAARFRDTYGL